VTTFDKPAKTIEEHIATLKERSLNVSDEARARQYLSNISYYRFSAYTRPFYIPGKDEHQFLTGTSFDDVLNLYIFDRELRLLLLDAIERIEVSLRAQMTKVLAEHYGPHGYLNADVFDDRFDHVRLLDGIEKEVRGRDAETFIAHYRNKYRAAPDHPPVWMAMELMTFSTVSILFASLKNSADTCRIEQHYGWRYPVMKSWFRALSDLRNKCAHHMRIWNREFGISPMIPRRAPEGWAEVPRHVSVDSVRHPDQTIDPQLRLYMQVVVIESLMRVVCPESGWAIRFVQLMNRHPQFSRPHMGFPHNWKAQAFWRDAARKAEGAPQ